MGAIIEVQKVTNRFGKQVVHDGLDMTLEKGEILGLVGLSGSGKSVLLRTLLGLHKPDEGKVLVAGKDVAKMSGDEKRRMAKTWGILFQDGALFSGLSVVDNVSFPLREYTKLPPEEVRSLSLAKLGLVDLDGEAAFKKADELSGGMVRRAALARALALDPEILFLDEPTSGLDPISSAGFDKLLKKLHEILGLSVLIITHDLDTLVTICDRVAMLVDKKIIAGTIEEMMHCEKPEVKAFFRGQRMRAVQKNQELRREQGDEPDEEPGRRPGPSPQEEKRA